MLNQSSWFIRISSAHVDLIRNLMIHFTLRQIISELVQPCHRITLSHFKTYRINCHFYESFHFMTIHSTCVVFLVVTAAHINIFAAEKSHTKSLHTYIMIDIGTNIFFGEKSREILPEK